MCLQKVARTIETRFHRSSDHVSRYGGEEFAVILPATDTDSALAMAQQLCGAVFDLGIRQSSPRTSDRVTVSVGLATLEPGRIDDAQSLTEAADGAPYRSKAGGRNRVERESLSTSRVGKSSAASAGWMPERNVLTATCGMCGGRIDRNRHGKNPTVSGGAGSEKADDQFGFEPESSGDVL